MEVTNAPHPPPPSPMFIEPDRQTSPSETQPFPSHSQLSTPPPSEASPPSLIATPSSTTTPSSSLIATPSSTTTSSPGERRAGPQLRNPYASAFRFHPPSDFAPTRRAPGGIRCATINVQSIANQARREAVYHTLQAWDLDILALQETWLSVRNWSSRQLLGIKMVLGVRLASCQ